MLTVLNGNQAEPILETGYEKIEEQNGAALQISFSSYKFEQNIGHDLIDFNVIVEDEDRHRYKVKQLIERPDLKNVLATHVFYELIGHRKTTNYNGSKTFNDFATWLFSGTGWTFINEGINEVRSFNSFGDDNFLQLIQRLIIKFDCEMKILPNNIVRFAKRIGEDDDKQYRLGNNIKEISRTIDTTNVRTRIKAEGANGLTVTYTSPLASNTRFGVLDADPVKDDAITTQTELLQFAMSSLNDTPETNIDVSVLDLDGQVGDYVWIIHEDMNLQYCSRILSKVTKRDYNESIVQIGNAKKRTIEDALIDQKEEVKENKEAAEQAIDEVNQTITETEDSLRSEITQTASSIRLEVQQVNQSVASLEITATQIQSNVTNLQNYTQSSITQLSDNINLKVDKGGVITDINLTPGTATINADKINLNGAVMVNGSITGSTDITVNRNVAVGNALYFGGTQGSIDFINITGSGMTLNSTTVNIVAPGGLYVNGAKVG